MDNGNLYDVNLQSGIDVQSSDMLVPVTDVKATQNRQLYQGGMLTTSFRYEQNGYAAGWCVYNFVFTEQSVPATSSLDTLYLSYLKYNNNPTYKLSLRSSEDSSTDALATIMYIPDASIISYSTGSEPSITDNTISGTFNGKTYSFTYNTITGDITNSSVLTITAALNIDYTTTFLLQDTTSAVVVEPTMLYMPSAIYNYTDRAYSDDSCNKITNYTSFENHEHTWGTYLVYNPTARTFIIDGKDVTASCNDIVVSDTNVLTFNYNSTVDIPVDFNMSYATRYVSFDKIALSDINTIIAKDALADTACLFNYWDCIEYNSTDKLTAGADKGAYIQVEVPVWFGISFCAQSTAAATILPDKDTWEIVLTMPTGASACEFPNRTAFITLQSSLQSNTGTYASSISEPGRCTLAVPFMRYGRVYCNDFIQPAPNFSFLRYKGFNSTYSYGRGKYRFEPALPCNYGVYYDKLNVYSASIDNILATLFKTNNIYEPINISEGTDTYNIIKGKPDILNIRSIIGAADPPTLLEGDDVDFMQSTLNALAIREKSALIYLEEETRPTIYSATQAAQAGSDMWKEGCSYDTVPRHKYLGATFVDASAHLSYTADNYWPFKYVPCFRLAIDGYDGPCYYWASDTDYVTTLEGYIARCKREFAYTQDIGSTTTPNYLIVNSDYCRDRNVFKASNNGDVYDIPVPQTDAEMAAWLEDWNNWYGANSANKATAPFSLTTPAVVKTGQYDGYKGIIHHEYTIAMPNWPHGISQPGVYKPTPTVTVTVKAPSGSLNLEGVILDNRWNTGYGGSVHVYDHATLNVKITDVPAFDIYCLGPVIPLTSATNGITIRIWEHTADVTDKYTCENTDSAAGVFYVGLAAASKAGTVNAVFDAVNGDTGASEDKRKFNQDCTALHSHMGMALNVFSQSVSVSNMLNNIIYTNNSNASNYDNRPVVEDISVTWERIVDGWVHNVDSFTNDYTCTSDTGRQRVARAFGILADDDNTAAEITAAHWSGNSKSIVIKPNTRDSWLYNDAAGSVEANAIYLDFTTEGAVNCSIEAAELSTFVKSMYGYTRYVAEK